MLGVACVLVSGAGGDPRSGLGRRLLFVAERDRFPGRRGPGAAGGLGAGGLGRSVAPPTATPRPLCPAALLGGAAPGGAPGAGGGRRLDSCSRRGGFFSVSRALPTFIFALLQAARGWRTYSRSFLARLGRGQYWLLMTILNHRT